MYENRFYERLSELRIKKGVSARDMSLSIGQNAGYINHIENRQTFPSLPVFFTICDYFEITPQDFFSEKEDCISCVSSVVEDLTKLTKEQLNSIAIIVHDLSQKNNAKK